MSTIVTPSICKAVMLKSKQGSNISQISGFFGLAKDTVRRIIKGGGTVKGYNEVLAGEREKRAGSKPRNPKATGLGTNTSVHVEDYLPTTEQVISQRLNDLEDDMLMVANAVDVNEAIKKAEVKSLGEVINCNADYLDMVSGFVRFTFWMAFVAAVCSVLALIGVYHG